MRAAVIVPVGRRWRIASSSAGEGPPRSMNARLEEAVGLALAIDLDIAFSEVVTLSDPSPATLLGSGLVAQLGNRAEEGEVGLLIIDHALTPVQQRNLEKAWNAKVIDEGGSSSSRTGSSQLPKGPSCAIMDAFGEAAWRRRVYGRSRRDSD
jgi:GTPase